MSRMPVEPPRQVVRFDHVLIELLRKYSPAILRISLGIVFFWFGALKVAGVSPVADLLEETVWWLPSSTTVIVLGVTEVLIGLGLIFGIAPRVVLLLFTLQMVGTFLTFFVVPGRMFDGNPLKLTVLGEFVVKNLVLLAAGLSVASTIPKLDSQNDYQRPR
jgi:putative oxidoreductase